MQEMSAWMMSPYGTYSEESTPASTSTSQEGSSPDNPKRGCPEECAVCGDKAHGYHYEVPACRGCRTFFRRTHIGLNKFTCKKDGRCFENKPGKSRVECRSCRYGQCLRVGMNPLAIQLDDLDKANKSKQTINLLKRRAGINSDPSSSAQITRKFTTFEESVERLVGQLVYLDIRVDQMRVSDYNPNPFKCPDLKGMIGQPNVISSPQMLKPMPDWPIPNMAYEKILFLSEEEQEELRKFDRLVVTPEEEDDQPGEFHWGRSHGESQLKVNKKYPYCVERNRKFWSFFDLLSTIEYAKTFPGFNKLKLEDRVILLKHVGLMCTNLMQAYYTYSNKSELLMYPDGTHPPAYCRAMLSTIVITLVRAQLDIKEYVLLKAILLCNAAVPDISKEAQQILNVERDKHALALLSYCLATKGTDKGPAHYSTIIGMIDTLHQYAQQQKKYFMLVKMQNSMRSHGVYLLDDLY